MHLLPYPHPCQSTHSPRLHYHPLLQHPLTRQSHLQTYQTPTSNTHTQQYPPLAQHHLFSHLLFFFSLNFKWVNGFFSCVGYSPDYKLKDYTCPFVTTTTHLTPSPSPPHVSLQKPLTSANSSITLGRRPPALPSTIGITPPPREKNATTFAPLSPHPSATLSAVHQATYPTLHTSHRYSVTSSPAPNHSAPFYSDSANGSKTTPYPNWIPLSLPATGTLGTPLSRTIAHLLPNQSNIRAPIFPLHLPPTKNHFSTVTHSPNANPKKTISSISLTPPRPHTNSATHSTSSPFHAPPPLDTNLRSLISNHPARSPLVSSNTIITRIRKRHCHVFL